MAERSTPGSWVEAPRTRDTSSGWDHPTVVASKSVPQHSSKDAERQVARDINKRLRVIHEEYGIAYGEDAFGEALSIRFKSAVNLAHKSISMVLRSIKKAKNVDLCFLVDVTGSMQRHIDGVRANIQRILDFLLKPSGKDTEGLAASLRLAFVGYRDFGDPAPFEILKFVSGAHEFRQFCSLLSASGGGDAPEDVFGGIEKALSLNWSENAGTRVIFHIADAPCHGLEFHDLLDDNYPHGDPRGLNIGTLFQRMKDKQIEYFFGKITTYTDIMIQKFSQAYGNPITAFDVKDPGQILDSVTTAVSMSVGHMMEQSKHSFGGVKKTYTLDPSEPVWKLLPEQHGYLLTYEMPKTTQDVIDSVPMEKKYAEPFSLKVAPNPFGEGAERIAYHGLEVIHGRMESVQHLRGGEKGSTPRANEADMSPVRLVLKEYKHAQKGVSTAVRYELANQLQAIAAFFAQKFQAVHGRNVKLKFLKTRTIAISSGSESKRYMTCERLLPGAKFVRFSNNVDFTLAKQKAAELDIPSEYLDVLLAFSHWTYHETNGFMMVVDLQGIVSKAEEDKDALLLTDPAIHCKDITRFYPLNLGDKGMEMFFKNHVCNSVCHSLQLFNPI